MANLDASLFVITPGQSGNPLSPHWGDLAPLWANGRSITLGGDRASLRAEGQVLTLEPAR
jgi:penicillin amidase